MGYCSLCFRVFALVIRFKFCSAMVWVIGPENLLLVIASECYGLQIGADEIFTQAAIIVWRCLETCSLRKNIRQGLIMFIPRRRFLPAFLILLLLFLSNSQCLAGDGVEQTGDILTVVLAASSLGMAAHLHDGEGAMQFAKSSALSLGATFALKYTVNEERPNGNGQSFPSGHTSISFASAEFLRKRYGWEYGLPAYAAASFVGYSRVESDNHYWHDVIAGAAIGFASSYFFAEPYHDVTVSLEGSETYGGIRLSRAW